ncbi:MAG: thiamine-phosphate kinase [Chloroflexi bacterium]|nr:thiamine-phosphate kinase [Chloroflexota bacterium]
MKVSELGEFGLIDLVAGMVNAAKDERETAWQQLVIGIGDDAAAWRCDNSIQLATVDALVQDVHFTLETTTWEELGWKALAVNLSDIAAMGGIPRYAMVSLTLPGQTEVDDVASLYRGMIELARRFGVAIIGGNMSSAPIITVHVTVLGSASDKQLLTRSAARPGEKIAVTGYLGAAAAGLEMLSRHLIFDKEATGSLGRACVKPEPRVAEGRLLVKQGVRMGIDVSDGLLSDLRHICQSSRVGARIEIARVPVHPAVKANFGSRALELALGGGEDYELLFTASDSIIAKVKAATSTPVTVIGEVTSENAGEIILVDRKGKLFDLTKMGWDHFAGKQS